MPSNSVLVLCCHVSESHTLKTTEKTKRYFHHLLKKRCLETRQLLQGNKACCLYECQNNAWKSFFGYQEIGNNNCYFVNETNGA